MSAIQRWYFTEDGFRQEPWDDQDEQWCKAQDVEELERLLAEYLMTIGSLRDEKRELMRTWSTACQEREALRMELQTWRSDRAQLSNEVQSLQTEVAELTDGDGL